jgi:hypothetical protein
MIDDIVIKPMAEEFILWRCLHSGPLSLQTIDRWPPGSNLPWETYRNRNVPLLLKLTQTYEACTIVALCQSQIVGQLRFYPKAVWNMPGAGGLCLQQDHPSGPADDFINSHFPALTHITDRTLKIHCLMTGSLQQPDNPFQRKGLGTRMVRTLIQWAAASGWEYLEAEAFEDLPIIYQITGSAGHSFWEKLGFSLVDRHPHPDLQGTDQFVLTLEEQARSFGIQPSQARERLIMRLNLNKNSGIE